MNNATTLDLLYEDFDTWAKEVSRKLRVDMPTAKDIVQDSFIKFYTKYADTIENYDKEQLTFYIKKALYNTGKNMIRSRDNRERYHKGFHDRILNAALIRNTDIDSLDTIYFLAGSGGIYMKDFYEKSLTRTQVAKKHKVSEDVVRRHMEEGRKRVRKHLKALYPLFMYLRRHCQDEFDEV